MELLVESTGQLSSLGQPVGHVHVPVMSPAIYKPQPCMPFGCVQPTLCVISCSLKLPGRYKSPSPSVVDRVLLTANETDQFLVKVMVRQCRRPEVGDKYIKKHIVGV